MTFDTRGHTMMGVSPEAAVAALAAAGADAIGGNCGNGPDELLPVIEKMRAVAPDVVLVAKSNAGMPELVDLRAVYRAEPAVMAEAGLAFRDAGRADHRGVLRLDPGPPRRDGGGARRRDLSVSPSVGGALREPLAGLDADRQAVLGRRQRARELRLSRRRSGGRRG